MLAGIPVRLGATTILFGLLGDPGHSYTFNRTDSPVGQAVSDPVAPYPGYLGTNTPGNQYGFFCIDYLKGANWNTTYTGQEYNITSDIPGKTMEQKVEAAYLSDKLYRLGGLAASTTLYQGPISFAIWQIMDPTPGHVPRDPAAQAYVLEAQHMYQTGQISAVYFPNTIFFVPDNGTIQDFMSLSPGVPEPGPIALVLGGLALIGAGRFRRSRRLRP